MRFSDIAKRDGARNVAQQIQPTAIIAYFDALHCWLPRRLTKRELKRLRQTGAYVEPKWLRQKWTGQWAQFISVTNVNDAVIRLLAKLPDPYLNYLEVALDWAFKEWRDADDANALIFKHVRKKWHGKQTLFVEKDVTLYSAKRDGKVKNMLVSYSDLPSRHSEHAYCTHVEWRLWGGRALERIGIYQIADLLEFDFRAFWKKKLIWNAIDQSQLGRRCCAKESGKLRRKRIIDEFGRDYDLYNGHFAMKIAGEHPLIQGSTQAVIDAYRNEIDIEKCLIPIDVEHLLPAERQRKREMPAGTNRKRANCLDGKREFHYMGIWQHTRS